MDFQLGRMGKNDKGKKWFLHTKNQIQKYRGQYFSEISISAKNYVICCEQLFKNVEWKNSFPKLNNIPWNFSQ